MADKLLEKLKALETQLQKLAASAKEDLEIAQGLQKLLTPNRLPKIQGLECYAKHVSALGLSSDGFEIVSRPKGSVVDFLLYWTESYGLSAVLMQALIHLSIKNQSGSIQTLDELLSFLQTELATAKKKGQFKILAARIHIHSLKIEGKSLGLPLPWVRDSKSKEWSSITATTSVDATTQHFQTSLNPGAEILFLGSAWSHAEPQLRSIKPQENLLDVMNTCAVEAQARQSSEPVDLSLVGLRVDPRKLHLA